MTKTFSWILYPHHEYLSVLNDEFLAGSLRVRLRGNSIEVDAELATGAGAQAHRFAGEYVELLRKYLGLHVRLLTSEEFLSMIPTMQTVRGLSIADRKRVQDAIRRVRNEMLASEDPTLRRCYDYLQFAREQPQDSLSHLYKAVEAIENELGGEKKASEVLNIQSELKGVKRLANEPIRNQRHPPNKADVVEGPSSDEREWALAATTRILKAYESYLRAAG